MDNKRYLIIGGGGFIGSNIASRLVANGNSVRILDNFSTGRKENLQSIQNDIEVVEGDIRDYNTLVKSVDGIDYVLHQAALPSVQRSVEDPRTSNEVNVSGTLNVLNAAKEGGVKRVVYASSSSVYGNSETLPKKEGMIPNPLSPYAITKLTGEYYCKAFYNLYGLETISLRYFNVFGPRQNPKSQYAAVIPIFISSVMEKREIVVFGDGEQSRDFTFIDNVVDVNIRACHVEKTCGDVVNVAAGTKYTLNQLIEFLRELMGNIPEVNYSEPRKGDVKHSLASLENIKNVLDYSPTVDFKSGLIETIGWFAK